MKVKSFQSNSASGLAQQMNKWLEEQDDEIKYLDFKTTSSAITMSSSINCIHQEPRIFGFLIYEIKPKYGDCPPIEWK